MRTRLDSGGETVAIDSQGPLVMIGERIDPSGKELPSEALAQGDISFARAGLL